MFCCCGKENFRKENKREAWKDMTCCNEHIKTSIMKFEDWRREDRKHAERRHTDLLRLIESGT